MRQRIHQLHNKRVRLLTNCLSCMSKLIQHLLTGRVECRASDKCQRDKRKTINGDDLIWAMSTLGFEEYVEPLKLYLHKYREVRLLASR